MTSTSTITSNLTELGTAQPQHVLHYSFIAYQKSTELHLIRVYFGGQTFDVIQKDEKLHLVDKISSIGGNLGLFTGFSLLSLVEIFYFIPQIVFSLITNSATGQSLMASIYNFGGILRRIFQRNVINVQEAPDFIHA